MTELVPGDIVVGNCERYVSWLVVTATGTPGQNLDEEMCGSCSIVTYMIDENVAVCITNYGLRCSLATYLMKV